MEPGGGRWTEKFGNHCGRASQRSASIGMEIIVQLFVARLRSVIVVTKESAATTAKAVPSSFPIPMNDGTGRCH
jgi:hypothetical protein